MNAHSSLYTSLYPNPDRESGSVVSSPAYQESPSEKRILSVCLSIFICSSTHSITRTVQNIHLSRICKATSVTLTTIRFVAVWHRKKFLTVNFVRFFCLKYYYYYCYYYNFHWPQFTTTHSAPLYCMTWLLQCRHCRQKYKSRWRSHRQIGTVRSVSWAGIPRRWYTTTDTCWRSSSPTPQTAASGTPRPSSTQQPSYLLKTNLRGRPAKINTSINARDITVFTYCSSFGALTPMFSASEVSHFMHYTNLWFTYLLTYFLPYLTLL